MPSRPPDRSTITTSCTLRVPTCCAGSDRRGRRRRATRGRWRWPPTTTSDAFSNGGCAKPRAGVRNPLNKNALTCYDHHAVEGTPLMTIGQLGREAGIRPSAIRYYERLGLLPAPERRSGRRDYTDGAVAHLAVVQFALATGFTLRETRQLVRGFSAGTPASTR